MKPSFAHHHSLSLPAWGPYSKRFFGLSHITDQETGARFDLFCIPGLYRRDLAIPDAKRASGYLPWESSAELENYSYRQQIEWKDRIYCDVSYLRISDHSRLVSCNFVNQTELNADAVLHVFAGIAMPAIKAVRLTSGEYWKPIACRPSSLEPWGREKNEIPSDGALEGRAFLFAKGAEFRFEIPKGIFDGCFFLRYRGKEWFSFGKTVFLSQSVSADGWRIAKIPNVEELLRASRIDCDIEIDSLIHTDGFAPDFLPMNLNGECRIDLNAEQRKIFLHPRGASCFYGLSWEFEGAVTRRIRCKNFMDTLRYNDNISQSHKGDLFELDGTECFAGVTMQTIPLAPHSEKIIRAVVCDAATFHESEERLAFPSNPALLERNASKSFISIPDGPFTFSQKRMSAVILTNTVFPIRIGHENTIHHLPGRYWDSPYTWDNGFIGLGLAEISLKRAIDALNAYCSFPESDPVNAFLLNGTPLPVQIYLYGEILTRTNDLVFARKYYPALRRFYFFIAGHDANSSTRSHSIVPMVCTWDINYNSGGWDDYPPQWMIYLTKKYSAIPVVGTAHAIRCAKILRNAARRISATEDDILLYERDIRDYAESLQKYSWDPECGYYSYIEHDENHNPSGILRDENGVNFNKGMDGLSPLVAAFATPEQRETLYKHIENPMECWTPYGISSVDQSAPYYSSKGYWNGSVWMAHQYFFWKSALGDAKGDLAWKIASTALELWEKETNASYACFEHFSIRSGRGAGWHHFSGLSCPVLNFFGAYFQPGRVTGGFDFSLLKHTFDSGIHTAEIELEDNGLGKSVIILTSCASGNAEFNGSSLRMTLRTGSTFELELPSPARGILRAGF